MLEDVLEAKYIDLSPLVASHKTQLIFIKIANGKEKSSTKDFNTHIPGKESPPVYSGSKEYFL